MQETKAIRHLTKNQNNSMKATFKVFRGTLASWEKLFEKATIFATTIGQDNIISISHSADHSDGVVTVWYWTAN